MLEIHLKFLMLEPYFLNPDSGPIKADVDFLIWSIGSPILN